MDKKNYTIGFGFLLYFIFMINWVIYYKKTHEVLQHFSVMGQWFSILIVLFFLSKFLIKKFFKLEIKEGLAILLGVILTAHLLTSQELGENIISFLSLSLNINIFLIWSIIMFLFFVLGCSVRKVGSLKIIGVALVLLFLNVLYFAVVWHSFSQQSNVLENMYKVVVENNITIKECEKISCVRFKNKEDAVKILAENMTAPKEVEGAVRSYMKALAHKILNNDAKESVSLSYGESVASSNNNKYAVIGVYGLKNNYLLIDYMSLNELVDRSKRLFHNIIGSSTIGWLLLLLLVYAGHEFIPYYVRRKRGK